MANEKIVAQKRARARARTRAMRFDADKVDISLIPPEYLEEFARVFMYGTKKYSRDNWRKGMKWSRMYSSAMRHIIAFWKGEELDVESGLPHLVQAAWNLMALHWYTQHVTLRALDDRWIAPAVGMQVEVEDVLCSKTEE